MCVCVGMSVYLCFEGWCRMSRRIGGGAVLLSESVGIYMHKIPQNTFVEAAHMLEQETTVYSAD